MNRPAHRVLVLYYSQTGRTRQTLRTFLAPLEASEQVQLYWQPIQPVQPYPYPWPVWEMLSTFPEVVAATPIALQPLSLPTDARYDLVVLAGPVWFLSSSLPISSLLQSEGAASLAETPVVILLTYRLAWLEGLKSLEEQLKRLRAPVVGRVVVKIRDRKPYPQFRSVLQQAGMQKTVPDWQFERRLTTALQERGERLLGQLPLLKGAETGPLLTEPPPLLSAGAWKAGVPLAQLSTRARLAARGEKAQKQRYRRWGARLRRWSAPHTRRRRLLTLLCLPGFMPVVYLPMPAVMLARNSARVLLAGGRALVQYLAHSKSVPNTGGRQGSGGR